VDIAIAKLNQGDGVHLFGEGKVNQPSTYLNNRNGVHTLPRFKWGVGRIIMESSVPPLVIPMWLTGFDQLMPEGREFPYKYFPRPGVQLSVTFGDPLPPRDIEKALGVTTGWMVSETTLEFNQKGGGNNTRNMRNAQSLKVRTEVTALVQKAVESLGRSISGDSLSKPV